MSKFQAHCEGFRGRREVQHPREEFTTRGDYESHMRQVHGRKVTRTRKPSMWKAPKFKPFTPEGVTLGTNVTTLGILGRQAGFQVWAPGESKGWWWIANGSEYRYAHERDMGVLAQCLEEVTDSPLIELAS